MEGLATSFVLGIASAASPCLLPLYPGFLAYLTANAGALAGRRGAGLVGLVILVGLLSAMLAVGVVLTAVAIPVGRLLALAIPLVDGVLIALGLVLLAGRDPFSRLPAMAPPVTRNPYAQAYAYGLFLGPLALPCAGPFLLALLAISVGLGDAVGRLSSFLAYGLGFGLPLVLISLLTSARQQEVIRLTTLHHSAILRAAGAVLVLAGAWDLWANLPNLRLAWRL
jgi:cytochrome c-type biogenesis protein